MYKNVFVGLGTALLGCIVTPIIVMIWYSWKATEAAPPGPAGPRETVTVSFSPLGFLNHFPWFWWFVLALGVAGFLISMYLQRRRAL